jgi:hypothetical protein
MRLCWLAMIGSITFFSHIGFAGQGSFIKYDISDFSSSRVRYTNYILTSLTPYDQQSFWLTKDELTIDCQTITIELCQQLKAMTSDESLDFNKLRDVWLINFLETRRNRGNHNIMFDSLADFAELSRFKEWGNVIVQSRVKQSRRRIYRGLINNRKISVSETLGRDGQVRETEVVLERIHITGDFEFYTYNKMGEMALESEFPVGFRPSPVTCVSCHLNSQGKAARFIRSLH